MKQLVNLIKTLCCFLLCLFYSACQERIFITPQASFEQAEDCQILKKNGLTADYFLLSNSNWQTVLEDCDRNGNFRLFYLPQSGYYRLSAINGSDTTYAGDYYLNSFESAQKLKIVMLDVKQGDSFVLFPPSNKPSVIDGGYGSSGFETWAGSGNKVLQNFLVEHEVDSLQYIFESHHHADHFGGLTDILTGGFFASSYLTSQLKPGIQLLDTLNLGHNTGVIILHAAESDSTASLKDNENNRSLVLKLIYKNFNMLFTGDLETSGETDMLSTLSDQTILDCEVLKAAHHGSSTSSSTNLLKKVQPQSVLISVGAGNPYNHPSESIVNRLKSYSEQLMRTDLDGMVTIYTDGTAYQIGLSKKLRSDF